MSADRAAAAMRRFDATRLYEVVCERIKQQILLGELTPGDQLPAERDLAVLHGVSRAVIREALRNLENSGLVRKQRGAKGSALVLDGRSALTRSFSDMVALGHVSIEEITEARILIEDVVVRLACERAEEADFLAMEADIARVDELSRTGRIGDYLQYSVQFYELLAAATHNNALVLITQSFAEIVASIVSRLEIRPLYDLAEVRREFMVHLRARDADRASAVMRRHFLRLSEFLAATRPKAERTPD
ncbi:FadR/GntR family transcriptional regulator [Zavarzinia sp. CC-PAN008]|uniref:FadR/GntR family transcriptional regulator n=1 Tax=Zavarzinia sp. CC-PAN008 TaxID=3243332 RepID=UPI003F7477D7